MLFCQTVLACYMMWKFLVWLNGDDYSDFCLGAKCPVKNCGSRAGHFESLCFEELKVTLPNCRFASPAYGVPLAIEWNCLIHTYFTVCDISRGLVSYISKPTQLATDVVGWTGLDWTDPIWRNVIQNLFVWSILICTRAIGRHTRQCQLVDNIPSTCVKLPHLANISRTRRDPTNSTGARNNSHPHHRTQFCLNILIGR